MYETNGNVIDFAAYRPTAEKAAAPPPQSSGFSPLMVSGGAVALIATLCAVPLLLLG